MIKNNIKALLINIFISILAFMVYIAFHASAVKWASEEAARQHHVFMIVNSALVIIVAAFLYYYLSRKFLDNQGTCLKNIASFSITALIGIVLWMTAFFIDLTEGTKILLNSQLWQLYSLYHGYSLCLVNEINITNPYIMIAFGILPIIVMYLGIKKDNAVDVQK